MTTKSDLETAIAIETQIAVSIAEFINSRSCPPSLEEIHTNLCDTYVTAMLSIKASKARSRCAAT
jgi:hypothetical protein